MKKFFMFLAVMGVMAFSAQNAVAQDEQAAEPTATEVAAPAADETLPEEVPMHQALKTKFIEGGAGFMALVIACLILGLALCIERILYLGFSKTNTKKLIAKVEAALKNGGYEAAKKACVETRGPVAEIFAEVFVRLGKGQSIEDAEKALVDRGGVESSKMEQNLSWISLFIAIAPSLGFLGTVIGMIQAFDAIMVAGDMSPAVVAGGMKVALITTVGGLIVAVILQIFYNYILSQVESLTIDMEDASINLMEVLAEYQK
ncbi:MAG: MotA/TolQ/ExbB proton channel family protein [Bacteroidales bacterium]|jgi:biopolymer transport protein ExbB|nr:MotA/TolQ/ExbB proton channel family protein [Bacteroidales bacterium]MBO5861887.1 MotA/TolQ/ExbB proton channel family protein [Bacteroidales bacterium]MBR1955727.1 MotA/TolQ/ExbB proton channel family protein [Bacteroidales bacterium]MBR5811150.1 MotA/TolQ/ExbB proton channel family protein [Bacteroidales bacterium]